MNPFIAFRSAAFAVLRPPRIPSAFLAPCSHPHPAFFHSSRILYKKKEDVEPDTPMMRAKRIPIPEHIPKPKPRRGKKIGIAFVHLQDPRTGQLDPLRPLQEILDAVDEDEYYVELVGEHPPVVKLVDIKDSRAATLESRLRAKRAVSKDMQKEAQLTWSMAPADEAHKLQKVREDLEKGYRVDIVYSPKKGQRSPPRMEMNFKLQEVAKKFEDVAKEWKPATVDRRLGAIFLQSKVKTSSKPDRKELKESVPKSVEQRKQRAEKSQTRTESDEKLADSYTNLWGV